MTKTQILNQIKRHCKHCPLRCDEDCPLHLFRDGIDTTKIPRELPEASLLNLKGYQRKIRQEVEA